MIKVPSPNGMMGLSFITRIRLELDKSNVGDYLFVIFKVRETKLCPFFVQMYMKNTCIFIEITLKMLTRVPIPYTALIKPIPFIPQTAQISIRHHITHKMNQSVLRIW